MRPALIHSGKFSPVLARAQRNAATKPDAADVNTQATKIWGYFIKKEASPLK